MRRDTCSSSASLKAAGAVRSRLSRKSVTSAVLRAGRVPEPEKMTSSMPGRAHVLVRAFAHHPAQRLDEVRLAAAVRPDHAGQAALDDELAGFDEGFEAEEAQPENFMPRHPPASGRRRPSLRSEQASRACRR